MFTNRFAPLIVVLVVFAAALVSLSMSSHPNAVSVHADRSYDPIEQMRLEGSPILADQSYDLVEKARLDRTTSLVQPDRSYDQIEQFRVKYQNNVPSADRSYDAIENLRIQRLWE